MQPRRRWCGALVTALGLALAAVACGAGPPAPTVDDAAGTTAPAAAAAPSTTSPRARFAAVDAPPAGPSLPYGTSNPRDRLLGQIQRALGRHRLSSALEVTMSWPDSSRLVVDRRRSSYDGFSGDGMATRSFDTTEPVLASVVGGKAYQFRLVAGTVWLDDPGKNPPVWVGFDRLVYMDTGRTDLLPMFNGAEYLRTLAVAATSVTEVQPGAEGGTRYLLEVVADDVALAVGVIPPVQLDIDDAATRTNMVTKATVDVDREGVVSGFSVDLSQWWTNALRNSPYLSVTTLQTMTVVARYQPFDGPLTVTAPCILWKEHDTSSGLVVQRCEPNRA